MRMFKQLNAFVAAVLVGIVAVGCSSSDDDKDDVYAEFDTTVTKINSYGNIELSVTADELLAAGYEYGDMVRIGGGSLAEDLVIPFVDDYLCSGVWGASLERFSGYDNLTLALANASFSDRVGGKVGDRLHISMSKKGGYASEYKNFKLDPSSDRSDYASDEIYANFFAVSCYGIKEKMFYRSSTPLSSSSLRYEYSDRLAREAGVNSIITMADTEDYWLSKVAEGSGYGQYAKELYDAGNVSFSRTAVDIFQPGMAEKIGQIVRFILSHKSPYLICCSWGRDRTGYMAMILQVLAGATFEEIEADYMRSFYNYNHIDASFPYYERFRQITFLRTIYIVAHGGDVDVAQLNNLTEVDKDEIMALLPQAVDNFLTQKAGVTAAELSALKTQIRK
ncbi:MAG: tyrosine-protein phosphatase [Muribaculaceae bacterium]